jgi:hypothetical protein
MYVKNSSLNSDSSLNFNVVTAKNVDRNPIGSIATVNQTASPPDLMKQLFSLNKLPLDQLRKKWFELFKTNPNSCKRKHLIKSLAYRIQYLYGMSTVSEEDVEASLKNAKRNKKLNSQRRDVSSSSSHSPAEKTKISSFDFPIGTVIKTHYKNKEYVVKILDDDKFEYDGRVYTSLSAIASEIAGTRWNGYTFFRLKK